MADDKLYSVLWDIFTNVNEQLRFGEAKNGALVTLDFALVAAIGTVVLDHESWPQHLKIAAALCCFVLSCAGATSLASFFPFIGKWHPGHDIDGKPGNAVYFVSIAEMGERVFLSRVQSQLGAKVAGGLHADLANQITTNSRITLRKFLYFQIAGWTTLGGVVLSLLYVFIALVLPSLNYGP